MRNRKGGFTILEMVVVVMVGALLAGIALQSLQGVQGRAAARQARMTFASLHARARANSIETGQLVRLGVDRDQDSVWVQRGTTRVETVRFDEELGVDIQGTGQLTLCMNPRGFAETTCNSFTSTETVVFAAGGDTAGLQIRTMGQLRY
jgi:prepilin-type N-terminal cleavage/methylation domain-containing protein